MAKNVPAAAATALSGVALLIAIKDSENGYLMLTQAEGADIVNQGLASLDTSLTDGDKAAVRLTEAGFAEIAKANGEGAPATETATASAPAASGGYEIEDNVAIPTDKVRRNREGGYPFDKLAIGQSFHVAKTAENPDPLSRLQSSVSGAKAKYAEEIPGETEVVKVRTYQKDAEGKFVKTAEGKRVLLSETEETRPKTKLTRDFVVKAVGADDAKGEGARVWRVALDA